MKLTRRPRRLRANDAIRSMVRETKLNLEDLIYPLFIVEGQGIKEEIKSLPDNYHFSVDMLEDEIKEISELGIKSVILFGLPDKKDEKGTSAYEKDGVVQKAIKKVKEVCPSMYVMTDVCMCQYTSHGHCGILREDGYVMNDETLRYLSKIAVSHAKAGADMVAPSDMMDGRIGHMRKSLDEKELENVAIMSYSAKYCSAFYGPFRDAAHSAPSFGDRKTYQMDPANTDEAVVEAELDMEEGADIIMVKPALSYLDIIRRMKDNFNVPICAYSVSGEYAMIKNAVDNGILGEDAIMESMISIKRAGADMIITYFAKYLAKKLSK